MGVMDSVISTGPSRNRSSFSDDILLTSEPLDPLMMYIVDV